MSPAQNDSYQEAYESRLLLGSYAFSPDTPVHYLPTVSRQLGLSSYGMPRKISTISNSVQAIPFSHPTPSDTEGHLNRVGVTGAINVSVTKKLWCCCFPCGTSQAREQENHDQGQHVHHSAGVIDRQPKTRY